MWLYDCTMTLRNPELEIELQLCEHYVTLTVSPTGSLCCVMCAFGTIQGLGACISAMCICVEQLRTYFFPILKVAHEQ
jgi:hypothetical protein